MANYTEEQLLSVIKILAGEQDEKKSEEAKAAEEAKSAEEAKAAAEAKPAEEAKAAAEAKSEEAKSAEEAKAAERENKYIAKTLKAELREKGIDVDLVDSLAEFISYDTLKSDGEADDEKLKKFAEAVSGIANRVPPKGKSDKHDILNPKKEGLARYLPDTDN